MSEMTNERLVAIRQRMNKATEGPWDTEEIVPGQFAVYALPLQDNGAHLGVTGYEEWDGDRISADDAEFIAHAPDDLAALLAEVDRLRATVERVKAAAFTQERDEWHGVELLDEIRTALEARNVRRDS